MTVPQTAETVPWHARAADAVAAALGVDPATGLSADEAARRLVATGPNELTAALPVPLWRRFVAQFTDPLVLLLLIAIAISGLVWLLEGAEGLPVEPLVIVAIVALNAVLGVAQETRAERAVAALQRMTEAQATVLRDGREQHVPARAVVPGDVLLLGEGDAIAADARLLDAAALQTAEAALTGESAPVLKGPAVLPPETALGDRLNLLFKGTAVASGHGRAVVTATGMATEIGAIAGMLERQVEEPAPLEQEISQAGRLLGLLVAAIAVVVVVAILLSGGVRSSGDLVDVLLIGVSLAVAAVPEGLPAIRSVVLALGVQRMARRNAIVKQLAAVETLGFATVICTDKTGTLTRNEMTVTCAVTARGVAELTGAGYAPEGELLAEGDARAEVERLLDAAALASNARLVHEGGGWQVLGDPTEGALLAAQRKARPGVTPEAERLGEVPFTAERKVMSVVVRDGEGLALYAKGAPDVLLAQCTAEWSGGCAEPLSDTRRAEIRAVIDGLAAEALRTLAVACRPLPADIPADVSLLEQDLTLLGIAGMFDPPRPEAAAAIAEARSAGIRVVMITGDHPRTAGAIAAELGIIPAGGRVVTGAELETMDEEVLRRAAAEVSVFARVAPVHKLRLVEALQSERQVVAMTGDGVNDAPALKRADIGVAMGITGTDVSKEAARLILTDDNFATIVAAVREGRAIFANIRKVLLYLLSSNAGEVLTVFLGILLAGVIGLEADGAVAVPLLATHLLWINLITDSLPAIALGLDPPASGLMARPPRPAGARVIDRQMLTDILVMGLVMAAATLFAFDLWLPGGLVAGTATLERARTAVFTVLMLAQLINAVSARADRGQFWHRLFANRLLWGGIGVAALLQVAVVHLPPLQRAFGTEPLTPGEWLICLGLALLVLLVRLVPVSRPLRHQ